MCAEAASTDNMQYALQLPSARSGSDAISAVDRILVGRLHAASLCGDGSVSRDELGRRTFSRYIAFADGHAAEVNIHLGLAVPADASEIDASEIDAAAHRRNTRSSNSSFWSYSAIAARDELPHGTVVAAPGAL